MERRRRTPPPKQYKAPSHNCLIATNVSATEDSYLLSTTPLDLRQNQPHPNSISLDLSSSTHEVDQTANLSYSFRRAGPLASSSKKFLKNIRAKLSYYFQAHITDTFLSKNLQDLRDINGPSDGYLNSSSPLLAHLGPTESGGLSPTLDARTNIATRTKTSNNNNIDSTNFNSNASTNTIKSGSSSVNLYTAINDTNTDACNNDAVNMRLSWESRISERRRLKNVRLLAFIVSAFMVGSAKCIIHDETKSKRRNEPNPLGSTNRTATEEDEGMLELLREEFNEWVRHHRRDYDDGAEHERRFHIWKDNHFRTIEKNKRHGRCKMTKKHVFGSNHFKDLSPEEFQAKYLTGYTGPTVANLDNKRGLRTDVNTPLDFDESNRVRRASDRNIMTSDQIEDDGIEDPTQIPRHKSVQERYLKHVKETSNCYGMGGTGCNGKYQEGNKYTWTSNARTSTATRCKWYDASCWLKILFAPLYGTASFGSNEASYSQDSYPTSIDWRTIGAITDVHSQGSCGACWAITAVETIESVYYIKYGTLLDLSETEVIMCDDTCEMCNGGWPQNAYEYVAEMGGLLPRESLEYDGDFLMVLSMVNSGESDEMTNSQVEEYLESQCTGSDGYTRYGEIKSYAYATDKCTCYTDGSGCDCDQQDEALAVRNLASYGPATICLDASVWQDYNGGILSDESGCSAAFLDMNHCVQAVGYAFTSVEDENGESNSHSGDDRSTREGYWIVRNQWSSYWGMNGYIYIAMGSNTCGILNDMTQVFLK